MKFANIVYNRRNDRLNLGDDYQLLAIENLYNYMGIDYSEVVRIELSELFTWEGEELIVPISFPMISYNGNMNITCFSEKIVPVFLGLSIMTEELNEADIKYLNRFSPIGCRDYHTYNVMRKYDIPSYFFGCITLTMPRLRYGVTDNQKVYCVDISETLKKYIPKDILEDSVMLSQVYNVDEVDGAPEDKARTVYKRLFEEASCVITARLHVALPCVAAGIPIIFAKDSFSYRFEGIENFVKIYAQDEYNQIDWKPQAIDYEEKKRMMLDVAKTRILGTHLLYQNINNYKNMIGEITVREGEIDSVARTKTYLKNRYNSEDSFIYALWSVTQSAKEVNRYIKEEYKNAKLVAVIDRAKDVEFEGIQSKRKEELLKHENVLVLVCSDAAIKEAAEFFAENSISDFCYCLGFN